MKINHKNVVLHRLYQLLNEKSIQFNVRELFHKAYFGIADTIKKLENGSQLDHKDIEQAQIILAKITNDRSIEAMAYLTNYMELTSKSKDFYWNNLANEFFYRGFKNGFMPSEAEFVLTKLKIKLEEGKDEKEK